MGKKTFNANITRFVTAVQLVKLFLIAIIKSTTGLFDFNPTDSHGIGLNKRVKKNCYPQTFVKRKKTTNSL